MNLELNIVVPLFNSIQDIKINTQILLYPFYCIEQDVINPFEEFNEANYLFVKQIIFNNSIKVLSDTKSIADLLEEEDLFNLRREYTICLSTYELTKKLKLDYVGTISRAKRLGDFSVSTSKKTEGTVLNRLLNDSLDCIENFKKAIEELKQSRILPKTFAKGSKNPFNTEIVGRLWWTSDMYPHIKDAYGSYRIPYNNKKYKVGTFNVRGDHVPVSRVGFTERDL